LSNFAELKAFALKIEDKIEFLLSVPLFQRLPQASSGKQTFRAKFYGQKKKRKSKDHGQLGQLGQLYLILKI
jgi:hypothetical protein